MSVLKWLFTISFIHAYVHGNDYEDFDYSISEITFDTPEELNIVDVYVFYEPFNPKCESLFINQLDPIIPKLGEYVAFHLNPRGSATTAVVNDKIVATCKQGEKQCHGNKLHACAIESTKNDTKSTLYISCLMKIGSTDEGADKCGEMLGGIEVDAIKECARSEEADMFLDYYGIYTKVVPYPAVPFVLIKNKRSFPSNIKRDICSAFTRPPPPCKIIIYDLTSTTATMSTIANYMPSAHTSSGYTLKSSKQWLLILLPALFFIYYRHLLP